MFENFSLTVQTTLNELAIAAVDFVDQIAFTTLV